MLRRTTYSNIFSPLKLLMCAFKMNFSINRVAMYFSLLVRLFRSNWAWKHSGMVEGGWTQTENILCDTSIFQFYHLWLAQMISLWDTLSISGRVTHSLQWLDICFYLPDVGNFMAILWFSSYLTSSKILSIKNKS